MAPAPVRTPPPPAATATAAAPQPPPPRRPHDSHEYCSRPAYRPPPPPPSQLSITAAAGGSGVNHQHQSAEGGGRSLVGGGYAGNGPEMEPGPSGAVCGARELRWRLAVDHWGRGERCGALTRNGSVREGPGELRVERVGFVTRVGGMSAALSRLMLVHEQMVSINCFFCV